MTAKKLPPAKDWRARDIKNWTVATFQAYRSERHSEIFGVPYAPMVNWQVENGHVKRLLHEHGPEAVKRFIDLSYESYIPRPQYPGINVGFMLRFRSNLLQQAIYEQNQAKKNAERMDDKIRRMDELTDDDLDWI